MFSPHQGLPALVGPRIRSQRPKEQPGELIYRQRAKEATYTMMKMQKSPDYMLNPARPSILLPAIARLGSSLRQLGPKEQVVFYVRYFHFLSDTFSYQATASPTSFLKEAQSQRSHSQGQKEMDPIVEVSRQPTRPKYSTSMESRYYEKTGAG